MGVRVGVSEVRVWGLGLGVWVGVSRVRVRVWVRVRVRFWVWVWARVRVPRQHQDRQCKACQDNTNARQDKAPRQDNKKGSVARQV